jgi:hypothetical protein
MLAVEGFDGDVQAAFGVLFAVGGMWVVDGFGPAVVKASKMTCRLAAGTT